MSIAAVSLALVGLLLLPSNAWSQRNAGFVEAVPPPSFMTPGEAATVSVTMTNTGSVVWVPGTTRLGSQNPQDNLYWGTAGRVDLAHHVYPGQTYTFSFQVTAPQAGGTYAWQWRMVEEGVEWFGHITTVTWVEVGAPPPGEGAVEAGAELSIASSTHSVQPGATALTWKVFCNAWGTAPGQQSQGWLPVRVILRLDGQVLRDITYQSRAGLTYSYHVQAEVASSEAGRTVHCENRVNGHVSYYSQRYMPGNGPQFTEVRIKTFIPDEWKLFPAGTLVIGQEYGRPAILHGDDRGFDYHSQSYRTRMWGWLNNPAFDSQVLRAGTPPHPGLSIAYDYLTSLDGNGRITDFAKADTYWGPPEKVSWALADMSNVGCYEFSHLGVQANRAGIRIRCFHHASIPLVEQSPNIDWIYNMDFWFGDDNLFVTIFDSCIDYFPSHELYVAGVPVILSSAAHYPLGLIWPCTQPVSRSNQRIFQVSTGQVLSPAGPPIMEPLDPEGQRQAQELVAVAEAETRADTDFHRVVARALDSTSAHVRANAVTAISSVVSSLRYQPSRQRRYRDLLQLSRPLVEAGLRDPSGSVRRYALMALPSVIEAADAATVKDVAGRMFRGDTEPFVRAMALELLLDGGRSLSSNWALIEEGVRDSSPTVKAVAYRFAGFTGSAEALPLLLQGLNEDGDPWTRISAADALRRFVPTNPEVIDAVAARVDVEKDAYIKERMASILAQLRAMRK